MAALRESLHHSDLYSWARQQAGILRGAEAERLNSPEGIDWSCIAETLEQLAMSIENELYHRYVVLLLHLLKWRHQPGKRSASWAGSMREQRRQIARVCRKNPGVKAHREPEFYEAYESAREGAVAETGLPLSAFPGVCPFSLAQAEDADFWPEPD